MYLIKELMKIILIWLIEDEFEIDWRLFWDNVRMLSFGK